LKIRENIQYEFKENLEFRNFT